MVTADIQSELTRLAHTLRPVGEPVSVLKVAYELGTTVWLRLHRTAGIPSAQIDLDDRPPKIVLYRSAKVDGERKILQWEERLLSPRERFSVAHELGHWIVLSQFQIGPQFDKRMYWEYERAVNAFAGCLLVPDWLVAQWLRGAPEDIPVSVFALRYWAHSSHSSEEVIAKAVARYRDSIGFLKLLPASKSKDGTRVLQVLCCAAGEGLRLPIERSHIDSPELYALLASKRTGSAWLPKLRLGRCEPQDLRIAWRRGATLKSEEIIWLSLAIQSKNAMRTEILPVQLRIAAEGLKQSDAMDKINNVNSPDHPRAPVAGR